MEQKTMSLVIAMRGSRSEKFVDTKHRKVIPFVGANHEGEFAKLGVGLIFPGERESTIWGSEGPCLLIQSWRGMRILERIEHTDYGTLRACWTVAGRKIPDSDECYRDELARQLGADELRALRREVLASLPSADELNVMVMNLREKDVDVDSREIEEEIKAGRIATSPLEMPARETEERRRDN